MNKFNKRENDLLMQCNDERDKYEVVIDSNKKVVVCEKESKKPVYVLGYVGVGLVAKLLDFCEVDVVTNFNK